MARSKYQYCDINCKYLILMSVRYEILEFWCTASRHMPTVHLCKTKCPYYRKKKEGVKQ